MRCFGFEHVGLDQLVLLAVPVGVATLEETERGEPYHIEQRQSDTLR